MPDDLIGLIQETHLTDALSERYLAYALSTIMSRSLPGDLKPVRRRLIYAMDCENRTDETIAGSMGTTMRRDAPSSSAVR
jgi:DNA gyrase/topoisomerase IV subunit A